MTESPAGSGFTLTPPEPGPLVTTEQAAAAIPVAPQKQTEIQRSASSFVEQLAAMDVQDPRFSQAVEAIHTWGEKEIRATAEVSNRMLQRPAMESSSSSPQVKVAEGLGALRTQMTELDPQRADLTGAKRLLKWLPGGSRIDTYLNRYRSAEDHLNAITRALTSGKDELLKDNAAIQAEQVTMYTDMTKLRELDVQLAALDEAVEAQIARLRAEGRTEEATAFDSDLLTAVRDRRKGILLHAASNSQGYMALGLVHRNNAELARGVDRALSTTMSALRTAVMISQAMATQKLVLTQVNALNDATAEMIQRTARDLRSQSAEIRELSSSSDERLIGALQGAFEDIYATLDEADRFQVEANRNKLTAIGNIQQQLSAADAQMQRTARLSGHAQELAPSAAPGADGLPFAPAQPAGLPAAPAQQPRSAPTPPAAQPAAPQAPAAQPMPPAQPVQPTPPAQPTQPGVKKFPWD